MGWFPPCNLFCLSNTLLWDLTYTSYMTTFVSINIHTFLLCTVPLSKKSRFEHILRELLTLHHCLRVIECLPDCVTSYLIILAISCISQSEAFLWCLIIFKLCNTFCYGLRAVNGCVWLFSFAPVSSWCCHPLVTMHGCPNIFYEILRISR